MTRAFDKYENCKTSTPWGRADQVYRYGHGINLYSTPSHGGYKVSRKLNEQIPEYMRCPDGWYEEDCDWAVVVTVFPDRFDYGDMNAALDTLRNWKPEAYEKVYGVVLKPGESYIKDQMTKETAHV